MWSVSGISLATLGVVVTGVADVPAVAEATSVPERMRERAATAHGPRGLLCGLFGGELPFSGWTIATTGCHLDPLPGSHQSRAFRFLRQASLLASLLRLGMVCARSVTLGFRTRFGRAALVVVVAAMSPVYTSERFYVPGSTSVPPQSMHWSFSQYLHPQ